MFELRQRVTLLRGKPQKSVTVKRNSSRAACAAARTPSVGEFNALTIPASVRTARVKARVPAIANNKADELGLTSAVAATAYSTMVHKHNF